LRLLVIYAGETANSTLSYQRGWPRAFRTNPGVSTTFLNLADAGIQANIKATWAFRWGRFDAIVLLHSVYSNACYLTGRWLDEVASSKIPKALFMGNEYKNLPEKLALARRIGVALLVTMLHHPRAIADYRERLGCEVFPLPSAGHDPELFANLRARTDRSIDIGYRAYDAPFYLGHRERNEIANCVGSAARARGLTCDISLDPVDRLDETQWAAFLTNCVAQIGTEAGGDYLDLDDTIRLKVNSALEDQPELSFDQIQKRFFPGDLGDGAGRALSGRITEAAAAGCAQILLAGHYAGYFQADKHYIALARDYSNVEECLDRLSDIGECSRIVAAAAEVARTQLTYGALIEKFLGALRPIVAS
jgi:hypothetical protein